MAGFLSRLGGRKAKPAPAASALVSAAPAVPGLKTGKLAAPNVPRFKSTAADQLDPKLSDRFAGVRMKLRNAFTPSQPVTDPRMFAGRTAILTTVIRAIEDQRLHAIVYGERGIGKTSLLHVLTQAAKDARYLVVYVSCGVGSQFDETFRSVAAEIPILYHANYGPTSPEAEKGLTFADLLPPTPVTVRSAGDLLSKLIGTRLLVILDEFDRADSSDFRLSIAELMKTLSDRSVRVQLVLAGVAANVTELVEHIPSIRRNVASLQVPKMTALEVRSLVENGETMSGLTFEPEAVTFVISIAHGLPYLASLLSHHAGLAALDDGRTKVTVEDVSAAIAEALDELKGRLSRKALTQIGECLRTGSLQSLGALAGSARLSGARFDMNDVAALYPGADSVSRLKAIADDLVSRGLLLTTGEDEVGSFYRFVEEGVPSYLWVLAMQERLFEGQKAGQIAPQLEAAGAR
jgi:Cdc6-like AAA superfamily ATPase